LPVVGIPARPEEFVISPQLASRLRAEQLEPGSKVLVVGGPSLAAQMREVGLVPVDTDTEDVAAVVQGWSADLDWLRLAEGAYAIRHGAHWMATNVDATLPTARALAPATGGEPAVAGKPEPGMVEVAAREHGARRPLIVGDRLDTDIEGAVRAGMDSLLVLTGVDGIDDALRADPVRRPTVILPDLSRIAAPFPLPVVDGDRARCGAVRAIWDDGDIAVHGEQDDPRVLRAVLALLREHSGDSAWTGRLRTQPAPAPVPADR